MVLMKKPSVVDSPSGEAPTKAPRWDLMDTEGYGGGNSFLWSPLIVTSQIFNLECYTLDHQYISYFICFQFDPRNSMQLKNPQRELGISLFSYLCFLKF